MRTICTLIVIAMVCFMTTAFVWQAGQVIGGAVDDRARVIADAAE